MARTWTLAAVAALLAGCGAPGGPARTADPGIEGAARCVGRGAAIAALTSVEGEGDRRTKARALANC